ncbi:hypothetical protein [Sphingomonas sp.]|uniref:hypothetical protein n=1 Tax=Sphingomonas sp. TaxID=28214 RepID=UPI0028B2212C|nr:hypothetical protein [Sphingomonas sp.]
MLSHLIALGLFAAPADNSAEKGAVIATGDRTAVMTVIQPAASRGSAIPLGAGAWAQQFDPGDHAPYAIDFAELLDQGEGIAKIEAIKMSSTAALLGIGVDAASGYRPIIDAAGKKIQLWFLVDQAYAESISFAAGGVLLPVSVRILTDATPPKRYERTAVLTVRQL